LDDFLHGRPERILHAQKLPRILLVWHHGNEELCARVAYHVYTQRPDLAAHIDYLCGDPAAAQSQSPAAVLGYDVNRSYIPVAEPDYAQTRAQEILQTIQKGNYDIVLDLHTTTNESEQFFIIRSQLDEAAKRVIAASPTNKAVAMPDDVTEKTLLGHAPNAIAFECNEAFAETPTALQEIIHVLEVLTGKREPQPLPREIYYVDGLVPKAEDPGEHAENFVLTPAGYYPVLLGKGKHAYRKDPTKPYACFGAKRKQDIVL
jgi:hypothetical protein